MYVDDLIVTSDHISGVTNFISKLCSTFDIHDLGDLSFFLGLKVSRSHDTLYLTQSRYAVNLFNKFNIITCKLSSTYVSPIPHVSFHDGELLPDPTMSGRKRRGPTSSSWDKKTYDQSMVGGLQYLSLSCLNLLLQSIM